MSLGNARSQEALNRSDTAFSRVLSGLVRFSSLQHERKPWPMQSHYPRIHRSLSAPVSFASSPASRYLLPLVLPASSSSETLIPTRKRTTGLFQISNMCFGPSSSDSSSRTSSASLRSSSPASRRTSSGSRRASFFSAPVSSLATFGSLEA